jgi:hypothetical protein
MLHRRALDVAEVEPDVLPSLAGGGRRPGRRVTALVALAAAVAVAVPLAVVLADDGSGDGSAEVGPATEEPVDGGAPVAADGVALRVSAPFFAADGSPAEVAMAYLDDRGVQTTHTVDGVDLVGDTAFVRWSSIDDVGTATPGTLELHRLGPGRWGVFAAAWSGMALDATRDGEGTVRASASAPDGGTVCVEIVGTDGAPIAGLIEAAVCTAGPVEASAGDQPVLVRAFRTSRAVDAVAEIRLDAPVSAGTAPDTTTTVLETTTTLPVFATTSAPVATTGPAIDRTAIRVQVYNGAGIQGAAGAMTDELAALGYPASEPATADTQLADTRIYARPGFEPACEAVRADLIAVAHEVDLSGTRVRTIDPTTMPVTGYEGADCVVVLGEDLSPTGGVTTTTQVLPPGTDAVTTTVPAG